MLRRVSGYLFLLVLISIYSCTREPQEKEPSGDATKSKTGVTDTAATKIPLAGSLNGDTIYLNGKFVLFYSPADDKGDASLTKFKETASIVVDSLKKAGDLGVAYTSVNNFKIYLRTGAIVKFSTSVFTDKKGMLVMDGLQPPTVKKGLLPIAEYHALIKKYFMRP